jgi:hypothetical protein
MPGLVGFEVPSFESPLLFTQAVTVIFFFPFHPLSPQQWPLLNQSLQDLLRHSLREQDNGKGRFHPE